MSVSSSCLSQYSSGTDNLSTLYQTLVKLGDYLMNSLDLEHVKY